MLRVADIMTTDVITVSPELGLRDAMSLFTTEHISGAPVVSGHEVLGVVTTTDLLDLIAQTPGAPSFREPIAEAGEPVVPDAFDLGDEPPATFFTELWEDVGADVAARAAAPDAPEWNILDEHTVSEAMSERILQLPPDTDVPRAADYMRQHGIHRVLVMEGDRLLGIVTTSDISNAVADHRLTERRFVFGKPQVRQDGAHW